ncbi:hypothetical protein CIK05_11435 [Bdellovibrio sp. qaytius]|nr:hypothetical protein CIK05_11435 [Bdellovibrio sp. qaytius]
MCRTNIDSQPIFLWNKSMTNILRLSIIIISLFSSLAFAEDELGPHHGHLKSAGAFLVEVLINQDGSFDVFLLDSETKKTTIRYSYVTGSTEGPGQAKQEILCVAQKEFFECYPRAGSIKKAKKLSLSLARENVTGNDLVYTLPMFNPSDLKNAKARIQSLQVSKVQKFISFRNGKRASANVTELEAGGSYCALENFKLQDIKIKTTKKAVLKIEKLEFPNAQINRFSVLTNSNYSIYCDFTKDPDFKMASLIEKINQHMAGFLHVIN